MRENRHQQRIANLVYFSGLLLCCVQFVTTQDFSTPEVIFKIIPDSITTTDNVTNIVVLVSTGEIGSLTLQSRIKQGSLTIGSGTAVVFSPGIPHPCSCVFTRYSSPKLAQP